MAEGGNEDERWKKYVRVHLRLITCREKLPARRGPRGREEEGGNLYLPPRIPACGKGSLEALHEKGGAQTQVNGWDEKKERGVSPPNCRKTGLPQQGGGRGSREGVLPLGYKKSRKFLEGCDGWIFLWGIVFFEGGGWCIGGGGVFVGFLNSVLEKRIAPVRKGFIA